MTYRMPQTNVTKIYLHISSSTKNTETCGHIHRKNQADNRPMTFHARLFKSSKGDSNPEEILLSVQTQPKTSQTSLGYVNGEKNCKLTYLSRMPNTYHLEEINNRG